MLTQCYFIVVVYATSPTSTQPWGLNAQWFFMPLKTRAALRTTISSSWWTCVVIQCWFGVVPALQTVVQHWAGIGLVYHVYTAHCSHAHSQQDKDALPGIEGIMASAHNAGPTFNRYWVGRVGVYSVGTLIPAWSTPLYCIGVGRRWRRWTSIEQALV